MEKENINAFMLYGINGKVTTDECVKNEIIIIFLSVLLIVIGVKKSIIFFILGVVPILSYLVSIIKLKSASKKPGKKEVTIDGVFFILHSGIFLVCLSYIFALASIEIIFYIFNERDRMAIIGVIVIGYIAVVFIYKYMIKKLIEKNAYGRSTKRLKGGIFFSLFGVLGMSVGRILFKTVHAGNGGEIACILFLFLSYLCSMGIFNIFKYKYLVEHKELLERANVDTKK